MKRRTFLYGALGLSVAGAGTGALWLQLKQDGKLQSYAAAGIAFGTTISLQVLHHDALLAHAALDAAMTGVKQVDALMSLRRADSQLSQLNQHGRFNQPDARFVHVLQTAQELAARTDGAFDVTVQPLWNAAVDAPVDAAASDKALALVDWRKLSVSSEYIDLSQQGMAVTLNGVDQALQQHGIHHALLNTGEFGTLGQRADGTAWTLGIRDPRHTDKLAQVLLWTAAGWLLQVTMKPAFQTPSNGIILLIRTAAFRRLNSPVSRYWHRPACSLTDCQRRSW